MSKQGEWKDDHWTTDPQDEADAHAIVLAHNALPVLLDIAEAARQYIDWQYRQPGARRFTMTDLRAALDRLEEVGS
jgi:hypothetical protein